MFDLISQFMTAGGEVLYLIAALCFVMWTLILERFWYFLFNFAKERDVLLTNWHKRSEYQSWQAHKIRELLLSQIRLSINRNMDFIQVAVVLCPLFGLLGTVWGMVDVFNVMAITGSGEVRAMASGVSKATIPTMAGMVAALSGLFASTLLNRHAQIKILLLTDELATRRKQ